MKHNVVLYLTMCKYSTWCLVAANTTVIDCGFITCFKRHNKAADLSSERQHINASFNCSGSFDSTSNLQWQQTPLSTPSDLILLQTQSVRMFKPFSHQMKKKSMSRWALTRILYTHTELTSLLNHTAQGYACNAWVVILKHWWWRWNAFLKRQCIGTIWCGCQPNKMLWILSLWHLHDMY